MGKGPESPDGDVSVPERKDEVAGGGGEEEEAEERGRVGGRGGNLGLQHPPARTADTPPRRGEAQEGGATRDWLGRGGRTAPPSRAMLTPGA